MGTKNAQTHLNQENDETCNKENSIDSFFAGSTILVTGATGFVGKSLVEKLLRACPRLAMIFILIRPKRSQTIEERFKNFLEQSVFDGIRSTKLLSKLHPIKGDVSQPDLALSPEDKGMLLEKVNVLFHVAATVRFNEPLNVAVNLNTKGTLRIVELARSMRNLISMVHVSTAYSNSNRYEISEVIYPTKVKPSTVIDMCEGLDQETLTALEEWILENHPNTYTFTKNLAEQIVLEGGKGLPLSIVRPSIIGAAEKEPSPGWIDNVFGLSGTIVQASRGAVKSFFCNVRMTLDLVPVDHVVDTLICVAWQTSQKKENIIKIYNCTNNAQALKWGAVADMIMRYSVQLPTKHIVWYPYFFCGVNRAVHSAVTFVTTVLPSFFADLIIRLKGGEPSMMKFMKFMDRMFQTSEFFTTREWNFHRDNLNELREQIKTLKDHDNFIVGPKYIDWHAYIRNYVLGVRHFVLKDPIETLKTARSRLYIFYFLHRFVQVFSVIAILAVIIRIIH